MRLGEASQLSIGCIDVEESFRIYEKIGFNIIAEQKGEHPWKQISDSVLLLFLNQDGLDYLGITYFSNNTREIVAEMEGKGIEFLQKSDPNDSSYQALFMSPDKVIISLIEMNPEAIPKPTGKTLLDFPQSDYGIPEKYPNKKCGVFGELCHPVADLNTSLIFWRKLGFESVLVNDKPYPWSILTDGINVIGLHETAEFDYMALTYFSRDTEQKVAHLREIGIDSIRAFGKSDNNKNVVLTTPENRRIFLFSL